MPGFSDFFTQDADFVIVTGKWLKGRTEIVSYHKDLLADFYKGSRLSPERGSFGWRVSKHCREETILCSRQLLLRGTG